MTQPRNGQQQPATGQRAADAATVAALAALLVAPHPSLPRMRGILHRIGVPPRVAHAVINLVLSQPLVPTLPIGAATKQAIREVAIRRAQYTVNAALRITRHAGGDTRQTTLLAALNAERQFFRQHVAACYRRIQAGAYVDSARNQHGPILGWESVRDERTSPECRAAHGKNFFALRRPLIGWPGSVHPSCRCRPTKPFRTRRLVDGGLLPKSWPLPDMDTPTVVAASRGGDDPVGM